MNRKHLGLVAGVALFIIGLILSGIGDFMDAGEIERIVQAGGPLHMNTSPQIMIMCGIFLAITGFFCVFGYLCNKYTPLVGWPSEQKSDGWPKPE